MSRLSSIATRPGSRSSAPNPAYQRFARAAQRMIASGQRPQLRVLVLGLNGLSLRLVVEGLPGAIAHARTRRTAREIARASVATALRLDLYAFDLQVDGA